MEKEEVIEFLKNKIPYIDDLKSQESSSPDFKRWHAIITSILERVFEKDSSHLKKFQSISFSYPIMCVGDDDYDYENARAYKNGLEEAKAILKGIIEEIKKFGIPTSQNQQNSKNAGSQNIINITQNQSVNIKINTVLKNNLTDAKYEEFETIIQEKDENKKSKKLIKFLEKISANVLVEIVKSLLL